VYNWIVDFYAGRAHATKFRGEMSAFAQLMSSVIQGSSLGPASYIVTAADLRPQHATMKSLNLVLVLIKFFNRLVAKN